jgi:antitoxin PrlF
MAVLQAEATLTDRYQTTVPASVRQALNLQKHDKLIYLLEEDGKVILKRGVPEKEEDPVLGQFLEFLARDVAAGNALPLTAELQSRINDLIGGMKVDLDEPLPPDDE